MKFISPAKLLLASLVALFVALQGMPVTAADARNFNAGRIIDDGIFSNNNSMSVVQIQSFLNSKTVCDTWGQKPSELGGGTRAQWLAAHGIPTPITCLRDYHENPSTGANNYGKAIPPGGISAAQIIYNYSQQFNINPQVLIVTLQKENGLITDEWPTPKQYSEAMGFGCPDNVAPGAPACDPNYGSFSAQIYQAARHFRGFMNNAPGWWIPFTTGNNTIRWSPNAACGSSVVNIQNRATVALYSYTPYQPNQAAKDAQYGRGDGCSAYGNRNFYMYFTDWFGSVYGGDAISSTVRLTSPITLSPARPVGGQTATVSYTVRNFSGSTVTYDTSVLQCRYNTTSNCDSSYGGIITIVADASRTFTHTITLPIGSNYTFVPFFMTGGIWYRYGVETSLQNATSLSVPDIRLTTPITTSPTQPVIGQPVTVAYTARNFGTQAITYDTAVVQCRYDSTSCDSAYTGPITINPGAERHFSHTITPLGDGGHTITPYFMNNGTWHTYTASAPTITLDVPDVRLTSEITTSPAQPIPGQSVTVSYTVKNFGTKSLNYSDGVLQCRLNTTAICDSYQPGYTLAPGETKTLSATIASVQAGSYRLVPYFMHNNKWYEYNKGTATVNKKTVDVPVYVADMRLTADIVTSPAQPIPGEPVTVTYTVKNFGTLPAIYQESVLQCRLDTNTNCDAGYTGPIIIAAGDERQFSYTITNSARSGTYDLTPYYLQNNTWYRYGSSVGGVNTKRLIVAFNNPDVRLTGNITLSPTQPIPGEPVTVTYTVKNFGSKPIHYTADILQCRRNITVNCDPLATPADTLDPGEEKTFTATIASMPAGSYRLLPYYLYDNRWFEYGKGTADANLRTLEVR